MSRRERKKEETRRRILEVAMDLFERNGFDEVTMEGIAEQADIAKATLYSYFPAKEAMLVEWMQRRAAELGQRVNALLREEDETRGRIRALFALIREVIEARRPLFERYVIYRMSSRERFCSDPTLRSGIDRILERILAEGRDRGEVRKDLSSMELTTYLESLFLSTLMMWLAEGEAGALESRVENMLGLFFEGAGVSDGR